VNVARKVIVTPTRCQARPDAAFNKSVFFEPFAWDGNSLFDETKYLPAFPSVATTYVERTGKVFRLSFSSAARSGFADSLGSGGVTRRDRRDRR
jgi:hypothetical protein